MPESTSRAGAPRSGRADDRVALRAARPRHHHRGEMLAPWLLLLAFAALLALGVLVVLGG